jgi:hypothetical protein
MSTIVLPAFVSYRKLQFFLPKGKNEKSSRGTVSLFRKLCQNTINIIQQIDSIRARINPDLESIFLTKLFIECFNLSKDMIDYSKNFDSFQCLCQVVYANNSLICETITALCNKGNHVNVFII